MSNPYLNSSGGSRFSAANMPAGTPGLTPRRTSYASVVSGSANIHPSRAGAFSHLLNHPNDLAYETSYQQSRAHSRHDSRATDVDMLRNGSYGGSGSWGRNGHVPNFSSAFASLTDSYGYDSTAGLASDYFFVPSYLKGSKYVQRLEETHKAKMAARREALPMNNSLPGSLSTSSSSANLHAKMAAHRGVNYDVIEKAPLLENENLVPLPSKWNTNDKYGGLDVQADGQEVKFTGGRSSTTDRDNEAYSIRADHPMPSQCGIYYFEVTILSRKREESSIAIGFSSKEVSLSRLPGWEPESWAYHGDDGNAFGCQSAGKHYGPPYTTGDIVGCGINFRTGCAFFTKNGDFLGTAFREIKGTLFPSVGMKKSGEHIRVNFGQSPFVFDIDGMMNERIVQRNRVPFLDLVDNGSGIELSEAQRTRLQRLWDSSHGASAEARQAWLGAVEPSSFVDDGQDGPPSDGDTISDRDFSPVGNAAELPARQTPFHSRHRPRFEPVAPLNQQAAGPAAPVVFDVSEMDCLVFARQILQRFPIHDLPNDVYNLVIPLLHHVGFHPLPDQGIVDPTTEGEQLMAAIDSVINGSRYGEILAARADEQTNERFAGIARIAARMQDRGPVDPPAVVPPVQDQAIPNEINRTQSQTDGRVLERLGNEANQIQQKEKRQIHQDIAKTSTAQLAPPLDETNLIQSLVLQYLSHDGYVETARAFAAAVQEERQALRVDPTSTVPLSNFSNVQEDEDAVNRQRIRTAILDGDVDRALKHTNAYYPNVLRDNEHIYFRLRSRKFVEMIKQAAELRTADRNGATNGKSNGHNLDLYDDMINHDMDVDDLPSTNDHDRMDISNGENGVDDGGAVLGNGDASMSLQMQYDKLIEETIDYGKELQVEYEDDLRREVKQHLEDCFALLAYDDPMDARDVAHLLRREGRISVAEELNAAILVSLGKSSSAALERLIQQSTILLEELSPGGGPGTMVNVDDYIRTQRPFQ